VVACVLKIMNRPTGYKGLKRVTVYYSISRAFSGSLVYFVDGVKVSMMHLFLQSVAGGGARQ